MASCVGLSSELQPFLLYFCERKEVINTLKGTLSLASRLAVMASVGLLVSTTAQSQENISLCVQGWNSYQRGLYDQAISLYEDCIKTGNLSLASTAKTYRNIGMAHNAKKDRTRAIASYNRALELNPSDPWSDYVNRGNAWSAAGEYNKALDDYETALKLKPEFDHAYFNRGIVFERLGNIEKAKADILVAYEKGLRTPQIIERMTYYQLPTKSAEKLDPNKPIESTESLSGVLMQLATTANGKATCFEKNLTLADIRPAVQDELRRNGIQSPNLNQVATAFYTLYPCPFSPNRVELRSATQKDVEGVWLNPESSQKYRFPPQSLAWQQNRLLPIKCEAVGFYPDGEMRVTRIAGLQAVCGFKSAADLEFSRHNPRVANWNLIRDGRLNVSRTDVENHVEEWDAFLATTDFDASGLQVKQGDLICFLRKERGNDLNISATFWHLKKLP